MEDLSFWLDYYDDVYSDFDSRKYHKRRLSEDFINELKYAVKYGGQGVSKLMLILPPANRNVSVEKQIEISLKEQFRQRLAISQGKEKKILKKGLMLIILGICLMATDAVIALKGFRSFQLEFLRIVMEPAWWFMVWTGLDTLTSDYKGARKETTFYQTISRLEIVFGDI